MSDIRLKNALSQMKNTAVERNNPVRRRQSSGGEAWSVDCRLQDPADAQQLRNFMRGELELYNRIVDTFNPTARTSPETFGAFSSQHISLFMKVAEFGIDFRRMNSRNLPEEFEEFRNIISDGSISERMKILMEAVAGNFPVIASTKRAMVKELIKFYTEDARLRSKARNSDVQMYQTPLKTLNTQTSISKRHLQVLRDQVKIRYDEAKNQSFAKTPYNRNEFVVTGVDLTEKKSWNLMIIHQHPNAMVSEKSKWVLDFRGGKQDYLVDYLDNRNDRSGVFWQAQVGRKGR